MNIIGIFVFNVYLQIVTKSKKVTQKSISYAALADPELKSYLNISLFKLNQLDMFLGCKSFYSAF